MNAEYNRRTSAELGWDPSWFGCSSFDDELLKAVKAFQRSHGLTADGLVGPSTFRRIYTQRVNDLPELDPGPKAYSDSIVFNGKFYPIKWNKVCHWFDEGGLAIRSGAYRSLAGQPKREIQSFVNHWDVCLNSAYCVRVLNKRGISVHFAIDNDGTIFQLMDLQDVAWHAGSRRINDSSVGVEISNAWYLKYQETYIKKGFGPRPVLSGVECQGKVLEDFLGFYDVQLQALSALWEAVSSATGIPLAVPGDSSGYDEKIAKNGFEGFINHYHVSKNKIDCAGLDMPQVLKEAKALREGVCYV